MYRILGNGRVWCEFARRHVASGPWTHAYQQGHHSKTRLYTSKTTASQINRTTPVDDNGAPSASSQAVPLSIPIVPQVPIDSIKNIIEFKTPVGLVANAVVNNDKHVVASLTSIPGFSRLLYHYMMLSKFRLTSLVVMTTMAGYAMAPAPFELSTFLLCSLGTTLVSGAANSINQVIETSFDAQMARTRNRVLVQGHLSRLHAVGFAMGASTAGIAMLYFGVNELTAVLGAANLILYTSIYTPMKRYSILNTWVGSVVGAIPPLMGWAACTGDIGAGAWILAGLLYCWQFPHFNALSWNIRPEYLKAGYKMMANSHPKLCTRVSLRHTGYITALSLLAPILDVTNVWFAVGSIPVNAYFAYLAWDFHQKADSKSSRKLFRYSLLHLPLLMALFLLNKKHWIFAEEDSNEASIAAVMIDNEQETVPMKKTDAYLIPNIVADVANISGSSSSSGSFKAIEDHLLTNVASVLPTKTPAEQKL
ncbi:protoheme IX farnesyltransferase, mitochondrial [Toxorhynchites rutilus septentrionalis]|uniref:protoheme IX farnesyltransferase, mitochondrial n=1 Tax=Toxorhynchites rutilus septentrionalis TaxID=329112 RepID=UPI002478D0AE|nr:protoheme IX farnesyltransferase, mitochondrial [Toxorhynchites rutilus septentrionalis]